MRISNVYYVESGKTFQEIFEEIISLYYNELMVKNV